MFLSDNFSNIHIMLVTLFRTLSLKIRIQIIKLTFELVELVVRYKKSSGLCINITSDSSDNVSTSAWKGKNETELLSLFTTLSNTYLLICQPPIKQELAYITSEITLVNLYINIYIFPFCWNSKIKTDGRLQTKSATLIFGNDRTLKRIGDSTSSIDITIAHPVPLPSAMLRWIIRDLHGLDKKTKKESTLTSHLKRWITNYLQYLQTYYVNIRSTKSKYWKVKQRVP